jgi:2-C-methyl-D-erythritol 2,4-cyclodiphosphate synthase
MLESFPENLRRVIFFARYEAVQDGSPRIECTHLLLGLARQMPELATRLGISEDRLRENRSGVPGQPTDAAVSTTPEVPLSSDARTAMQLAAAAADQTGAADIGPEHLLCGLFLADARLRSKLEEGGLTQDKLTELLPELLKDAQRHDRRGSEKPSEPPVQPQTPAKIRCGIGYDLHRLHAGRKMMIGGIEVPFERGPVGHSDGDVLVHAICDALLGAAALGDIGTHFPDTDRKWKGAASLAFLVHIRELLADKNLQIVYIDGIVIAERPKLGPHFPSMRVALAGSLGIGTDRINLKAKTNEGMDAIGRGEAIAAHAIATLQG